LTTEKFLKDRAAFARGFAERINADLKGLGMSGTRFSVGQIDPSGLEQLGSDGGDISPGRLLQGEFMICTNVGQKMLPLTKIASGGELSRIMLAIKVQQRTAHDATLIFDEIDAGISGQTAIMIASRLKSLAEHAQSIVITHLHQVAALADSHLRVSKTVAGSDTIATIQPVDGQERVMELARMMGGENPSSKVIAHARELMKG
jgi:DNA repair protein RecN (Recombination protein N)